MRFQALTILIFYSFISSLAQENMQMTNATAEQVLLGNYSPANYSASSVINHPDDMVPLINNRIDTDSLHNYLLKLSSFYTRHTSSDTVSSDTGMGAARRWAFGKLEQFSQQVENRLEVSYLQFDTNMCGNMSQHKNTLAILPGMQTADPSIIILEAHMDSRCEDRCDSDCKAHGMEDNGSGTALVLELARVMSNLSFNHTIVFMLNTGEEQGLFGARAFADYCVEKGIEVKAVLNNDVIGGIICGETSSEPSCPGLNHIDSTQVRLFSQGSYNSDNKSLARFVKLEYQEELLPIVEVPMMLTIMAAEDREFRGGDHIPFRQNGFPAIRFTSANEHGNANTMDSLYHDRQHTTDDILGVDTDNDMVIDSFFVDFNYLSRNAVINGTAVSMLGVGPKRPDLEVAEVGYGQLEIEITDQTQYETYRVGVRTQGNNDFDSVYTISSSLDTISVNPTNAWFVSTASVDSNGVESRFSREIVVVSTGLAENEVLDGVQLMQNRPNPFDEATTISVYVNQVPNYKRAQIVIRDMNGRLVKVLPIQLQNGMNEVLYFHGYQAVGTYVYALDIDGEPVQSKRMVFAY